MIGTVYMAWFMAPLAFILWKVRGRVPSFYPVGAQAGSTGLPHQSL